MRKEYELVGTQEIGKYTISVRRPKTPKLEPFDWHAHNARTKEIESIIQNALARSFREFQATEIKELVRAKICPKCRGRLQPHEDGMKCFQCGLIVYQEMYRDKAFY